MLKMELKKIESRLIKKKYKKNYVDILAKTIHHNAIIYAIDEEIVLASNPYHDRFSSTIENFTNDENVISFIKERRTTLKQTYQELLSLGEKFFLENFMNAKNWGTLPWHQLDKKLIEFLFELPEKNQTKIINTFDEPYLFSLIQKASNKKKNRKKTDPNFWSDVPKELKYALNLAIKDKYTQIILNAPISTPLNHRLKIISEIEKIEKPFREELLDHKHVDKMTLEDISSVLMKRHNKYHDLDEEIRPTSNLLKEINTLYRRIKPKNGKEFTKKEIIEAENKIKLLYQMQQKQFKTSRFKSTHHFYDYEPEKITYTSQEIINFDIANFYLNEEAFPQTKILSQELKEELKNRKSDKNLKRKLTEIIQESQHYKQKVKKILEIIIETEEKYIKKEIEQANAGITITKQYIDLEKEIKEYEQNYHNNWFFHAISIFPHDRFLPKINTTKIETPQKKKMNHFYKFFLFEELTQLKIWQEIKTKIAKTKKTDLVQEIQQIQKKLIDTTNYVRTLNEAEIFEYTNGKKENDETKRKERINIKISDSPSEFFRKSASKNYSSCLRPESKFENQGFVLFNNSHSLIMNIIHNPLRTQEIEEKEEIKEDYLLIQSDYFMPKIELIGQVFLYSAKIKNEETLFVAGMSGSTKLNEIPSWPKIITQEIENFAKINKFKYIAYNLMPLGDVRDSNITYNHELVHNVAKEFLLENEYTYKKRGKHTGRKPPLFQLTNEAKERNIKKIEIQRDPELIGKFYIEGLYPTKKQAINSGLILEPHREQFKPCFITKKGYAPILKLPK